VALGQHAFPVAYLPVSEGLSPTEFEKAVDAPTTLLNFSSSWDWEHFIVEHHYHKKHHGIYLKQTD
jgi:hypothetical protein